MVTVEKRKVSRTGTASLGWFLGRGHVTEIITVKTEKWCVIKDGKILAECRGKAAASQIAEAFNWIGHGA